MTPPEKKCPFCDLAPERILAEGPLALAVRDSYPLNPGHALIVPRRPGAWGLGAAAAARAPMRRRPGAARRRNLERPPPDAFNLGINDGPAAGQTIAHLHLHLIPRYEGDATDPRGGVRWIIPERAAYWIRR